MKPYDDTVVALQLAKDYNPESVVEFLRDGIRKPKLRDYLDGE